MSETCTCRELHLNSGGRQGTGCFELDYDCPLHGLKSEHYNSPEQRAKRRAVRVRAAELQAAATARRRGMTEHETDELRAAYLAMVRA